MIVLDANLLLYAADEKSPFHAAARQCVEDLFSSDQPVGLPWQSLGAFLRLSTNRNLPGIRFSLEEAAALVDAWIGQPNVRLLAPASDQWPLLRRVMIDGQASGTQTTDAQLAALTIEHGGTLYTTDRDFARFPGLRWKNPLV